MDRNELIDAVYEAAYNQHKAGLMRRGRWLRIKERCDNPGDYSRFWNRVDVKLASQTDYAQVVTAAEIDWEKLLELIIKYLPLILELFM